MVKLKTGDIVLMDFSPTKGHEQKGYRPALVVSDAKLQERTGMIWIMPISSASDKFPTHFTLETKQGNVAGTVLCEHIRAVVPQVRNPKLVDEATEETMQKCKKIIDAITYIN